MKGERAGIRAQRGDSAASGPTGAPWIDSNGWLIRLARFQNPDASIWVESDAPAAGEIVAPESYLVSIADAAAFGGCWVIKPDARCEPRTLQRMAAAVRFFRAHNHWNSQPSPAVVGVFSDFAGPGEFFGREILNLAERRHLAYRLLSKTQPDFDGLKAVLYADSKPPAAELRRAVMQFVENGGLLIARADWGAAAGPPVGGEPHPRFEVGQAGSGRIALARNFDDPFLVAADAQVLAGRRHDIVRFWNGGALLARVTGPADRSRLTVQLVNYTGTPANDAVSMQVAGRFRSATMTLLEQKEPRRLRIIVRREAVELHLPPFAVYAAVELT